MWIILLFIAATYIYLSIDKTIDNAVLYSHIFGKEFIDKDKNSTKLFAAILFPITIFQIINIKFKGKTTSMKNFGKIIKIAIVAAIIWFGIIPVVQTAKNYYNKSVDLQYDFDAKMNERVVVLDRITKIVHQVFSVAKLNDTSYSILVQIIASNRADGMNLAWKWAHENNPNANYHEVSALYQQVINAIKDERNLLYGIEQQLASLDNQYSKLHTEVPSSWYLFYRKGKLNYKPISTSDNKEVNRTGIDNKVDL